MALRVATWIAAGFLFAGLGCDSESREEERDRRRAALAESQLIAAQQLGGYVATGQGNSPEAIRLRQYLAYTRRELNDIHDEIAQETASVNNSPPVGTQ